VRRGGGGDLDTERVLVADRVSGGLLGPSPHASSRSASPRRAAARRRAPHQRAELRALLAGRAEHSRVSNQMATGVAG
jgi:hypothetical protein